MSEGKRFDQGDFARNYVEGRRCAIKWIDSPATLAEWHALHRMIDGGFPGVDVSAFQRSVRDHLSNLPPMLRRSLESKMRVLSDTLKQVKVFIWIVKGVKAEFKAAGVPLPPDLASTTEASMAHIARVFAHLAALGEWLVMSPDGKLYMAFHQYLAAPVGNRRLPHARTIAGLLERHGRNVRKYLVAADVAELTERASVTALLDAEGRKLDAQVKVVSALADFKGLFTAVAVRQRLGAPCAPYEQRGAVGYLGKLLKQHIGKLLDPLPRRHYAAAQGDELIDFQENGAAVIAFSEPGPESEELRAIQARLGLSLRGFARELGCSHTLLILIHKGVKQPTQALMARARKL